MRKCLVGIQLCEFPLVWEIAQRPLQWSLGQPPLSCCERCLVGVEHDPFVLLALPMGLKNSMPSSTKLSVYAVSVSGRSRRKGKKGSAHQSARSRVILPLLSLIPLASSHSAETSRLLPWVCFYPVLFVISHFSVTKLNEYIVEGIGTEHLIIYLLALSSPENCFPLQLSLCSLPGAGCVLSAPKYVCIRHQAIIDLWQSQQGAFKASKRQGRFARSNLVVSHPSTNCA